MPSVKVKTNYQVTLPEDVRVQLGIAEGDLLDVQAKDGAIVFKPKPADPEHLALIQEGLADYERGDVSEGFDDMDELLAYVNDER